MSSPDIEQQVRRKGRRSIVSTKAVDAILATVDEDESDDRNENGSKKVTAENAGGMSNMNQAEIIAYYSRFISASQQNKLLDKNAFSYDLIDALPAFVKETEEKKDFHFAACTLAASVKIYAAKVDNAHRATLKMADSLKQATWRGARDSSLGEGGEEDGADGPAAKKKKKQQENMNELQDVVKETRAAAGEGSVIEDTADVSEGEALEFAGGDMDGEESWSRFDVSSMVPRTSFSATSPRMSECPSAITLVEAPPNIAPPQIPAPSQIRYPTRDKRVDMKRLEMTGWEILQESKGQSDMMTIQEFHAAVVKKSPEALRNEISPHLNFLSLLHLCNERGVELQFGSSSDNPEKKEIFIDVSATTF